MENENKNPINPENNSGYQNNQIPEINSIPPLPGQEPHAPTPNYNNANNPQQGFAQQNNQQQFGQQQQQAYNFENQQKHNYTPPVNNGNQYRSPMQINVPNSVGVLILGILSILTICCCGPFLGPILATIALFLVPKSKRMYNENPNLYKLSSFNNLKTGQICAIIGLALGIILAIYLIITSAINPDNLSEINEAFGEAWNEMGY